MSDSGSDDVGGPIVIDNGSDTIKAGFSGEDAPCSVFPSVIGRPRSCPAGGKEYFAGDDARANRGTCTLRYPIEHGVVTNWDAMEKIWHHAFFDELRSDPQVGVVMTDPVMTPRPQRETMTQIMFETFETERFYVERQPVLSLYAAGRTTGCVVDLGHGMSQVVPVYEGYSLPHAIPPTRCPAGSDLTDYLGTLLKESGAAMSDGPEVREVMRNVKEKMCYVALDPEAEQLAHRQSEEVVASLASVPSSVMPMDLIDHCVNFMGGPKSYDLPDGGKISVGAACFRCPEAIFHPRLMGREDPGLHELVATCIRKCECDITSDLYDNIVLSGASTMFRGFPERLTKELTKIAPAGHREKSVKVIAPPERERSAWIGASILSSLATFTDMWITKDDYDENGPAIVHRKCF